MAGITAPGLGSGLDVKTLVEQLVSLERQPAANRLNLVEARANRELSGLGKLKSALANFKSVVATLTDLTEFQTRKATVSDADILSVSPTSVAVEGSYTVDVLSLAARHKISSKAFTDAATAVGYGTLSITVDGVTSAVVIDAAANTLADIIDAINDAEDNPGVVASLLTAADGAHVIFSSRDTGAANAITIAASGGDAGLAVFDYAGSDTASMTQVDAAADAQLTIDGLAVTSESNSVADAIQGVTLTLEKADPGNPVTVEVEFDEAAAKTTLERFVGAYNTVAITIAAETSFDADTGLAGALLGDSTVRGIQDRLRRELSSVVTDSGLTFSTLAEIGIQTTDDGLLELKDELADAALAADFDGVGKLFASAGGIATSIDALLENILDDETGTIETREGGLRSRLKNVGADRERLDSRMEIVRRRLQTQFDAMDLFVAQLTTTSNFLLQQFG